MSRAPAFAHQSRPLPARPTHTPTAHADEPSPISPAASPGAPLRATFPLFTTSKPAPAMISQGLKGLDSGSHLRNRQKKHSSNPAEDTTRF